MVRPWKVKNSKVDRDYGIFSVRIDVASSASRAHQGEFYVIESSDWINVIPLTAAGEVVMIRQYRHGIRKITLEIPGGLVEPTDSDHRHSARRELMEETGYDASELVYLGTVFPNPAIQNNRCLTFLAKEAFKVGEPSPEPFEELEIVLVPLATLPERIRLGEISHSLVLSAFFLYFLKQGKW